MAHLAGTDASAGESDATKGLNEACKEDVECKRGRCHTKEDGSKVCVNCSASTISNTRREVEQYCKNRESYPRKCDVIPGLVEVSESFFKKRIENGEKCIESRKYENAQCWDGGDQGHRDAVDEAEKGRANCYNELNTRRGLGGIYECSDSTYTSEARDVDSYCSSYGRACEELKKDDAMVNCSEIEAAIKATDRCVTSVERLDSDCLPRLGSWRETQFRKAKTAYDSCVEILKYKQDGKLCK